MRTPTSACEAKYRL